MTWGHFPAQALNAASWILHVSPTVLLERPHGEALRLHGETDMRVKQSWDLLASLVVKNPLANSGDTGLILGPGRSHMPQSN